MIAGRLGPVWGLIADPGRHITGHRIGGPLPVQQGRRHMLNNIGPAGLLLIALVVLVLFGRGKVAGLMGEVGKGITSFKRGLNDGKAEIESAAADNARDITPEKDKV
jgi:sec-independent protein translocase protein TatA